MGSAFERLVLFLIHVRRQGVPVGLGPLWRAGYLVYANAVRVRDQVR